MAPTEDIPVAYASAVPMAPPSESTMPLYETTTEGTNDRHDAIPLPVEDQQHGLNSSLPETTYRALSDQGYTRGMADSLLRNIQVFPLRIWIVDNSGSMAARDGHRLLETGTKNQVKFVSCTRWAEMQQTVDYHASLSKLLKASTVFRMLNDPGRVCGPQQFSIAQRGHQYLEEDLAIAQSTMINTQPGGVTPLARHLQEIRANIVGLLPTLQQHGTKVAIVIATDGLPTNSQGVCNDSVKREFTESLRALEGLPVWVVVRLCTDENAVVSFWNDLDENLELSLEVLDDFVAEAQEVHEHNKWLNYGLPLHRMREMGFYHRLFDLLDERKLSKDELREFCSIIFGRGKMDGVPDPEGDWEKFLSSVSRLNNKEAKQWNPVSKRMEPWIDMRRLRSEYSKGWFASMFG